MIQKARILLLGATGYIGGSILSELLKTEKNMFIISALVRKPEQVKKLEEVGVCGLLFKDLDDFNVIREAASQHDVVIGAASARHVNCARACIEGLSNRKGSPIGGVHYIHTSGGSMLGDWPESGGRVDTSFHSDVDEDIFTTEKDFPENFSSVRKLNQIVVALGEEKKLRVIIITECLLKIDLVGRGTGLFTEGLGQVHRLMQLALKDKQPVMVGSGSGIWSRIHINDLSRLYLLIAQRILNQDDIPNGKLGYYFAENGYQSWKSLAIGIGKAGKDLGIFESDAVASIHLKEVAEAFYDGNVRDAEGVLASNSRIKGDRARQVLGWSPEFGEDVFEVEIKEVTAMIGK